MKISCPHCSQHLELDSETLIALEGAPQFDCPTCGGSGYRNTEPDADVGLDWMP